LTEPTPVPVMVAPFQLDALKAAATDTPTPAPIPIPTPEHQSRKERRHGPKRRHRRRRWLVSLVVVLLVLAGAGAYVGVRLHAAPPVAVVTSTMTAMPTVKAAAVAMPWPSMGQGAFSVPSIGNDVTSGAEAAVPIASLTKMMTAYIILKDHPLVRGQNGPNITITQTDVNDYESDTTQDEANAQVALGEVLTERQILTGMLVHSANNLALALARWDAPTLADFVAKMNTTARRLGMDHTHYADPSGFDQTSQSTAGDLLKVAALDMDNPTFSSIVQMSSVTLPLAGTISTFTPLLGFQGVIGVKSGFTTVAGGCDVLAVVRRVHGLPVLILAAVTGQVGPNVLDLAGFHALAIANTVGTGIGQTEVIHRGDVVAHVSVDGHTVDATATKSATFLTWAGVTPRRVLVTTRALTPGAKRGVTVGNVEVALGSQHADIPVILHSPLPRETLLQRLF
jgi:serine-type D-Ala-D-Ala carboxypeptidase (penicillin-binding protein 5/6)